MHNPETGEVLNTTPFSQQLAFLSKGCLDAELTQALADVVKSVRDTGKKGSISLTITVTKLNGRDEDCVRLIPAVKITTPKLPPYESVMYSTADGDLLREDPKQRKLDLREVPNKPHQPLVEIGQRAPLQQPGIAQNAPA
jgi:hypothetical protein